MGYYTLEEEANDVYGAKIKVIGVGGGGGNMINHMINEGISKEIDLMIANTDAKALRGSNAPEKIQLGAKTTKGLGAGMDPSIANKAAQESSDILTESLSNADIVFIASGLGGGTGTGAAPIIAKIAKENGALSIAVVTLPFEFEGKKRMKIALAGLEELKKEVDSLMIIPNTKLLSLIDQKCGLKDSFKIVDDVLCKAVTGMCTIILDSGNSDINLDFADVKKIMNYRGQALMGVGEARGENFLCEAVNNAIQSPLLDSIDINGAMGILAHFQMHPNCPMQQVNEAMKIVQEMADEDADVIWGTATNEDLEEGYAKVTIVATGFKDKIQKIQEIKQEEKSYNYFNTNIIKKVAGDRYDCNLDEPAYKRNSQD